MKNVDKYIDVIKEKEFVFPNPMVWNEFYSKFNVNNNLLKPLILAAWHHTSDNEKLNRLKEQLEAILTDSDRQEAFDFLNKLPESDWHKK